jgi:hypothetical protein
VSDATLNRQFPASAGYNIRPQDQHRFHGGQRGYSDVKRILEKVIDTCQKFEASMIKLGQGTVLEVPTTIPIIELAAVVSERDWNTKKAMPVPGDGYSALPAPRCWRHASGLACRSPPVSSFSLRASAHPHIPAALPSDRSTGSQYAHNHQLL